MERQTHSQETEGTRTDRKDGLVQEAMKQMTDQLNGLRATHPHDSNNEFQDIIDQLPDRPPTREEAREQTISWIRGQLPRTMKQPTREELEELIDRGY